MKPGMREAPLTRLMLDVSLGPTLGGDLRDVYLLVLNLNLRRKTYTQKRFTQREGVLSGSNPSSLYGLQSPAQRLPFPKTSLCFPSLHLLFILSPAGTSALH